ncbi:hypothetical protein VE03_06882 [Pseudogymnoascus sp. 23342-1-I1]|nr:hypothetical protein VE03_06882 [Pseudogymnoascus sp. 23342-1-I1]
MASELKEEVPTKLFLNNEYVESTNKEKLCVYNPATGDLVSQNVPQANEEDVNLAIHHATQAFKTGPWRTMANPLRRKILWNFSQLLEQHTAQLSQLSRLTLGAPIANIGSGEITFAAEIFEYYAGWVDKYAGESYSEAGDGMYKIVRHEALGVCTGIIPWNTPLASIAIKAAPALAMGNVFILKPSEKTPFAALALGALIKKAGFPPGVFQVLCGDGRVGAMLAGHMDVHKVSFTGSVATGKKIQQTAAMSNLKRVTLELGGKSPAVVFDDCNLENAVKWCVRGLVDNSGQICHAATRVYVQEEVATKFTEMYRVALEAKTIGDPGLASTDLGPLVDKAQFERVSGFIHRATVDGQGGQLLTGGKRHGEQGYFMEPTVFVSSPNKSEIHTQEIFGPVAILNTFKTEAEVLERANGSNFGLMSGVFTRDITRALRFSSAVESGVVGINCISSPNILCPFGGLKESGIGREMGHYALRAYTEPKTVLINMASN